MNPLTDYGCFKASIEIFATHNWYKTDTKITDTKITDTKGATFGCEGTSSDNIVRHYYDHFNSTLVVFIDDSC